MFKEFEEVFRGHRFLTVGNFSGFEKASTLTTKYDEDRLIGFVAIEDFSSPSKQRVGRLAIAVLPEYQGRGIGRQLINSAIQSAFAKGKEKIWLSVYSDNQQAISLYDSLGFIVEGVFRNEEYTSEYGYRDVYSMALFKHSSTNKIDWGPPDIRAKDIDNILKCVHTNWFSSGPQTKEFESRIGEYTGNKYNLVVNNGTSALYAAYQTLFSSGDTVLIPNFTFIATYNIAVLLGLYPVLVDVNPTTGLIDLDAAEKLLKRNDEIKGIISVGMGGLTSDYERLAYLKSKYNIFIIEDAAESLGAQHIQPKYREAVHISTFSLHASKIITSIEGGIISTNNPEIFRYIKKFISHGESNEKYRFNQIGTNFRNTDLNMAIACAQLDRIEHYISHRNDILNYYKDLLGEHKFQLIPDFVKRNAGFFCLYFSRDKQGLLEYLKNNNVVARPSFYSIEEGISPNSDYIAEHGVLLPLNNTITQQEALRVANLVKEFEDA